MELKVKYQYTYFIKSFFIKESNYEKYLLSLLKNENCKLKVFEKERDYNLYTYFIQNIREYFFPSFAFNKDKINELNKMNSKFKAAILSKLHCNIFEYVLDKKVQGKINKENGIFFNIDKIEIVCFDTGICFFVIKTDIDSLENFSDLLNFNYKFKDINSDFNNLKEYNNIKIQTSEFGNMIELSDFIDNITGVNNNIVDLKGIELYNKRFFTYTYCCIDQEDWNKEEDFKNIESDFLKYSNVLSSNNITEFNLKQIDNNIQIIEPYRYSRFGFTKQSCSLITSNVDINNYTKLSFDYENEYFYTLLISLYQRICLKKLQNDFKDKNDMENIRTKFSKFIKEIASSEITNSLTGTLFYNKWKDVFELESIYNNIINKYDVLYKDFKIEKNSKTNKIVLIALVISILLNIINLITLFKLK